MACILENMIAWRRRSGIALGLAIAASACGSTEQGPRLPVSSEESCYGGSLTAYCAAQGCPASPGDVQTVCEHPGGLAVTTRGPTDCGGTLVNTSYGTHATGYFFDDKDVLVAVRISNDTAQRCSDQQNESLSITYGTPCAASVPPSVLPCPSGSGGSAAVGGTGGASGSGFAGASGSSGGACASIANAPHAPGTVPPWSPRTDVTEATTCTTPQTPGEPVDECGCENRTCPTGETCVRATQPPPLNLGGPARDFNGCFPLCLDDQDCEAPQVCVGNLYGLMVCADVECRQDGDCTADPCGFCLRGYFMSHGSQLHADPSASRCEYPGNCIDASCGGCTASELGWHHCPAP